MLVEPGDKPRHAEGAIEIVRDVLFARPYELDRLAKFFGDGDRLADVFLNRCAAAETAAKHRAVHPHLRVRHAGGISGGGKRRRRILGRHPDVDAVVANMRRTGLRLHRGVREKRHRVVGLDALRGT